MATLRPCCWSSVTLAALSAGRTSAMTWSMPNSPAIRSAVARLSPVSMTTWTAAWWRAWMAATEVSRGASAMANSPRGRPSAAAITTVRPPLASCSRRAASGPRSTASRSISRRLPTATRRPPTVAIAPCPGTFSNPSAATAAAPAWSARPTIASASGCSELRSTAATSRSSSASVTPSAQTTSVTSGSPLVRVPVLSSTTVSIRAAVSMAMACLNRIPRWAPSPVPIMIAVGVASPRASGQAITTTVMANSSASVRGRSVRSAHAAKVRPPPTRATSTSQNAARSARRCPGALEFWASWTSWTIWARAVSDPTLVARTRRVPLRLMVAPMTWSPGRLWTGRLSPVTTDSSTSLSPSSTTPSVAILAPAAGAHLEPVAEQHERGQDARGLVEDLAAAGQGDRDRVEPAGPDRDGDQHHHVQGAGAQGAHRAVKEDPAGVEDHRQAEQQRPDVVAHPERGGQLEAEDLAADRGPQQDRDREQRRDQEPVAQVGDHRRHRHGAVPAVPHHLVRRPQ